MASRQREFQKRQREKGLCVSCPEPALPSTRKGSGGRTTYCLRHQIQARERQHRKHNSRRNTNAPSYKSEAKLAEIVEACPFEAPEWAIDEVDANPEATIEVKRTADTSDFFYERQGE